MRNALHFEGSTRELVDRLKQAPGLVTERDEEGRSLLHLISFNSQFEAAQVQLLVEHGLSVSERDRDGNTPLHHSRLRACTRALLGLGADPGARNGAGWTPIHTAASHGYTDLCAMLVAAGGEINAPADDGRLPWDVRFAALHVEPELIALGARSKDGEARPTATAKPRWPWFWGHFRADADAPGTERLATLAAALEARDDEELVVFSAHFDAAIARGYTKKVSGFAAALGEGGSDDGFEDFVAWLVSKGRAFYEAALKNPDTLADRRLDFDCSIDALWGVLFDAYAARTGEEGSRVLERQPATGFAFPAPADVELPEWDDAALERAFPKLIARRNRLG